MKFVVYALAVWRLTSLFVSENGPWAVFARIRHYAGVDQFEQGQLAELFTCFWCASVWCAGLVLLMPRKLKLVLAASSAAIMWERVGRKVDLPR